MIRSRKRGKESSQTDDCEPVNEADVQEVVPFTTLGVGSTEDNQETQEAVFQVRVEN